MNKSANPRIVKLCASLILFGAAYGFGSWAIDTASWLLYFVTAVLAVAGVGSLVKVFKNEQS